jgi:hypothetical protein
VQRAVQGYSYVSVVVRVMQRVNGKQRELRKLMMMAFSAQGMAAPQVKVKGHQLPHSRYAGRVGLHRSEVD